MRSATPTLDWCSRGRTWLLALLVGGFVAGASGAQTDAGSVDAAAEPPADVAIDAVPGDESAEAASDLVPAEPVDRIAAGEQALKTNISEFGSRSVQAAEAHIDLANAQREA
ncbi:MAG TPA: hypothetical protein VLI71_12820, partial [Gammaproteobacteria bacterium]|nr:hypothetical protein [Gammaproteobacteria bacterium]